ncbi:SpoIIE family protein phosphatase [Streptomyces sp. NPDC057386]|jgi:serine phosphatase RsbU (regulator of sigma subunit)/anti-sigma regulatory factor (Ser/Thr protein kinase)|uniref:SpoIIE family protein phosphatase n=1 Tax=unclassified Streptomyces TaxID=2593676 RepID=UPI00363BB47C
MGAVPTQRDTDTRTGDAPAPPGTHEPGRTYATLPGGSLAPGTARDLVRAALREWAAEPATPGARLLTDRLAEDAILVVSELVTNAVVHAGTDVGLLCRLEPAGHIVVEVSDQHPTRAPRDSGTGRTAPAAPAYDTPEYGRGLRLVATLAESWGITYRRGAKTVWARLSPYDDTHTVPDTPAGALDVPLDTALDVAGGLAPEAGCGGRDREWLGRGALSFLAEASDLLAGQLDEDLVAALTGQLIVPRLADWCAVWLEDEISARGRWGAGSGGPAPRPARVWHTDEHLVEDLRRALDKEPPEPPDVLSPGPVPYPWPTAASGSPVPGDARDHEGTRREAAEAGIGGTGAGGHGSGAAGAPGDPGVSDVSDVLGVTAAAEAASGGAAPHGAALAYRLVAGGRPLGTLVIGRAGVARFPDEVTGLVEDLSRRVALAIGAARQYARQATISAVLQRGLLPGALPEIPGMSSALVHEPCDIGGPSGDFYDLFPAGEGRWCFAVGDVQGKGPEAAVVIGLARPWLRLLAREGYGVADVLDRLNQLLLDDATEAADAAARALAGPTAPGDGPQNRFLSLLYGELVPHGGGVRCTLASAGHPLPLVLGPDGTVRTAARPQTLLGVVEDETYTSETVELRPGDTLLCVTDGVTERRSGSRQFDDGDGLAGALAGCVGLGAEEIATRIRRLVHEFGGQPPEDDLALLVLQAG